MWENYQFWKTDQSTLIMQLLLQRALCIYSADCWHCTCSFPLTIKVLSRCCSADCSHWKWGYRAMLLTCLYVASSKTNLYTVCDVQAAPCDILFTYVSSAFAQLQWWQPKWMGSVLTLGWERLLLKRVLAAEGVCLGVRDLWFKRPVQKSMLSCQGVTRDCQTPLAL